MSWRGPYIGDTAHSGALELSSIKLIDGSFQISCSLELNEPWFHVNDWKLLSVTFQASPTLFLVRGQSPNRQRPDQIDVQNLSGPI